MKTEARPAYLVSYLKAFRSARRTVAHVVKVSIMEVLAEEVRRLPKPGLALDTGAAGGGNTNILRGGGLVAPVITRALRTGGDDRGRLNGSYSRGGRHR